MITTQIYISGAQERQLTATEESLGLWTLSIV
jgi:hypothetical protein